MRLLMVVGLVVGLAIAAAIALSGRYALHPFGSTTAVYRLDSLTGAVALCHPEKPEGPVVCR